MQSEGRAQEKEKAKEGPAVSLSFLTRIPFDSHTQWFILLQLPLLWSPHGWPHSCVSLKIRSHPSFFHLHFSSCFFPPVPHPFTRISLIWLQCFPCAMKLSSLSFSPSLSLSLSCPPPPLFANHWVVFEALVVQMPLRGGHNWIELRVIAIDHTDVLKQRQAHTHTHTVTVSVCVSSVLLFA